MDWGYIQNIINMDILNCLENILGKGKIKVDEPLSSHTTFKIGGPAQFFFKAATTGDLVKAIAAAKKFKIKYYILGSGSNVLVSDKKLSGLVIKNEANSFQILKQTGKVINRQVQVEKVLIKADSGLMVNQLVRYTCNEGLQGIERLLGLPGTVGGAVYNNSKWTNPPACIGDVLYQAEILTKTGLVKTVKRDYFKFGYDYSILHKTNEILLTATFIFKTANSQDLWQAANNSVFFRQKNQPSGVATAGCIFKNIPLSKAIIIGTPKYTTSTGYLIDQVGLKNFQIGKAKFSGKHANFIINTGGAKAVDVIKLIKEAKLRVKHKFHLDLELEIILMGEFD